MQKENKKSHQNENANEHLANERTLLAWIRTGIGIIALGFVVVKFALFIKQFSLLLGKTEKEAETDYSSAIGILIVAAGALVLILSYLKYKQTEKQIKDANFQPSSLLAFSTVLAIMIISVLLILYLFNTRSML